MAQTPEQKREYQKRYQEVNKDKIREMKRRYRVANIDAIRQQAQVRYQRRAHGINPEDWSALWNRQEGCCYLCKKPMEPAMARLDHDYSCCPQGQSCRACQRGLAHNECNTLIGLAGDEPARLRLIADSLESAKRAAAQRIALTGEQLCLYEGAI